MSVVTPAVAAMVRRSVCLASSPDVERQSSLLRTTRASYVKLVLLVINPVCNLRAVIYSTQTVLEKLYATDGARSALPSLSCNAPSVRAKLMVLTIFLRCAQSSPR